MKRLILAFAFLLATPATADDLVSGLSQDQIQITSNYSGTDIVVFGAIENMDATQGFGGRDIVVVVRGPNVDMTVRKKAHVAGIWINSNRIVLKGVPSYYYVASTRPLTQIATPLALRGYRLGLANIQPEAESTTTPGKDKPYLDAIVRAKTRQGIYGEQSGAVEFLSPTLFRVRIPVSAEVPPGDYKVEVSLFKGGTMIGAQSTPFFVDQVGIERQLFDLAHVSPLLYGLTAVLFAALLGWLSSFVFRQAQ